MTAGRILLDMPNPALDRNGNPMPNAKLSFFEAGTSIEHDVYADSTLTVPLTNPLISDSAGRFPEIWGDTGQGYDVRWRDSSNALIYRFDNIYAVPNNAVDGSGGGIIDAAAFRAALGLGSAATEDAGADGHTLPFADGDTTISGAWNFTGIMHKDGFGVGFLGIPPNQQDVDYTFALGDRGKGVWHGSASNHAYTIPKNVDVAFAQGDVIYLRNTGTGVVTLTRSTGVVLRIDGASTDQNVALGSYGSCSLVCDGVDIWNVAGSNLS